MIHAYQEMYLNSAQNVLGDAFDYAVNVGNLSGDYFVDLFIVSEVSKRMEKGEPAMLVGKSGIEIVSDLMLETTGKSLDTEPQERMVRSREYWVGWAVAYYQWYSARSYADIFKCFSFRDFVDMYNLLHEADISKFVEIVDKKMKEQFSDTNLKRIRTTYGLSQSELAKQSGVSLRSIQMYEQKQKDINKASVQTLYRISKILGCTIEDLIEK